MKVLVVLAQPPVPEGSAAGRCAIGLVRGLQAHGVETRLLVGRKIGSAGVPVFGRPAEAPGDLQVDVVPLLPEPGGVRRKIDNVRRPMAEYRQHGLLEAVRQIARDVDVVHLEETQMTYAGDGLRVPTVSHIHCLVRRDRPLGWPWQNEARWGVECALAERAAFRRHRYLVASSPLVAAALRKAAPGAEVVTAPLTLDPAYYRVAPHDKAPTAGIIGSASWPPTARAIRRLVERVWPLVHSAVPEARLLVAGRGTDRLRELAGPGVEVLGEVEEATAFLNDLSVLLYPLDRGSGMKVKVLEAMACGVPVVTTEEGAEGIAANDGVIVEEDDGRLASATTRLLGNPAEHSERARSARRTFEMLYAPEPATQPLVRLYERMASGVTSEV